MPQKCKKYKKRTKNVKIEIFKAKEHIDLLCQSIDNVKEEHKELCEKLLDTINTENCPECPNPRPTYNQRTKIAPEGCGIGIFTVKG